jgi:hypothetical protein
MERQDVGLSLIVVGFAIGASNLWQARHFGSYNTGRGLARAVSTWLLFIGSAVVVLAGISLYVAPI